MKKTIVLSVIILLLTHTLLAQTIRRVNASPGVSGSNVYTSVQAAHDASVAGDTIYIEPTGINSGILDCSKKLTIIGNGYFLSLNSGTPANKTSSLIEKVNFLAGSENTTVTGLEFTNATSAMVYTGGVTITRCKIGYINLVHYLVAPNNFTISKCLITGTISYGFQGVYPIASGHLIANNIFANGAGAVNGLFNSIIINNTFYGTPTSMGSLPGYCFIFNVANSIISNNIFDFRSAPENSLAVNTNNEALYTNNTIESNVSLAQSGLPTGNGNVNDADETATFQVENPWFVSPSGWVSFNNDASYQLATNSPAIGVGISGVDAGAFGGVSPYVLSGLAPYPIITNFSVSSVGNASVPLQVSVSARSNN